MESLYTCIEQIDALSDDIQFYSNLGVILYCELHSAACTHYFQEYERVSGFVDTRPDLGHCLVRRHLSPHQLLQKTASRIPRTVLSLLKGISLQNAPCVGWVGNTTFPWSSLAFKLEDRGIRFLPVKLNSGLSVPRFGEQAKILELWAQALHQKLADVFQTNSQTVHRFGLDKIKMHSQYLYSIQAMGSKAYDLVVTGTLGHLRPRVIALQAQSRGIPTMTIHHGGHYLKFDEPYHALHEGILPDVKIVYGSIEEQRKLGTLGLTMNLAGKPIQLYSRPDSNIQRLFRSREIEPVSALDKLTALYIANTCEGIRYGPYRDVHPATYLSWQEGLLRWLEKQTGIRPLVRLHPIRSSTRYDLFGYEPVGGNMNEVLKLAHIFVIDYPTTALAYVAATDKPVLLFDIGLRRLHPAALEAVRGRCYYAAVDLLNPDEGFAAMESDLSRQCSHTFTPTFSLEPENKEEVTAVADAVFSVLSRQD